MMEEKRREIDRSPYGGHAFYSIVPYIRHSRWLARTQSLDLTPFHRFSPQIGTDPHLLTRAKVHN